ncbi:MAG: tRNA pseudouridine(38-40) synthase TruA [Thermoplasmata archaeon]
MRLALKFAYDGRKFGGFARQPCRRTVEGDIIAALQSLRILRSGASPAEIRYGAASRTDAGVSAIGNVIAFDTSFRRESLLPALNARLENIWFHSIAEVPEDFRPRNALMRWYRYHLRVEETGDYEELKRALRSFVGKHDFRNFCRPEGRSTVRSIRRVRVRRTGSFITVDFFSKGFLWSQVRRMVGAALGVSRGEFQLSELKSALDEPEKRADFPLAPPEPLFLMDVSYSFDFKRDERAVGLVRRALERRRAEAEQTFILAGYLAGSFPP